MSQLKLDHISVSLSGREILRDVSFSVAKGEVVGLIGPNGTGKSTALRTALGLVDAQEGFVTSGGEGISSMKGPERAKRISYVPQGAPVHWPLTVERTVALGRIPHLMPWQDIQGVDEEAIEKAMRQTDCWQYKDRLVTTLSGGERARVLLARTIAVGAEYMLADEPTASLDPEHQLQVMDIMRNQADAGVGVVLVMHDLGLAMKTCDKLVLLHEGRVLASGEPEHVLTDENLATAFNVRVARWQNEDGQFIAPQSIWDGT